MKKKPVTHSNAFRCPTSRKSSRLPVGKFNNVEISKKLKKDFIFKYLDVISREYYNNIVSHLSKTRLSRSIIDAVEVECKYFPNTWKVTGNLPNNRTYNDICPVFVEHVEFKGIIEVRAYIKKKEIKFLSNIFHVNTRRLTSMFTYNDLNFLTPAPSARDLSQKTLEGIAEYT